MNFLHQLNLYFRIETGHHFKNRLMQIKSNTFFQTILLFTVFVLSPLHSQSAKVYVSAHPDDWQLFMNPNAYHDLQNPENKVIFLHSTAGDAGSGTGNNSYYLAREEGSLRAIRFLCNANNNELKQGNNMNKMQVTINDHRLLRYSYGNAVVYFLRLPDGNINGAGFPLHDDKSLKKLYKESIPSITAIDNSSQYHSLDDLILTISEIITYEATDTEQVSFNIADTNTNINPRDHSDHINSSLIMQKVAHHLGINSVRLYQEYTTSTKPINVFEDDYLISAGTWGVTASGLSDHFHYSTWDDGHNAYIGRQYFRDVLISDLEKE